MSCLPKKTLFFIYLGLLLALVVFYWWFSGEPALSPSRPLEQAQRISLLEPGTYVARLSAKSISEETIFVTKKEDYLRFVPLYSKNGLWYPSSWTGTSVLPLEEEQALSFVPFQLQLGSDDNNTHIGPAVFVYCEDTHAVSCQVCVTIGETVYELGPAGEENGFFFLPMEQMNEPEYRSDRKQILSILSTLSEQEAANNTLAVSLTATLYDEDGQILQTLGKQYLPQ